MTDIPNQNAVATRPQSGHVTSAAALYDTDKFAHMQRMASALMRGTMLPEAVRGSDPDECFSNLLIVFDMAERLRVTPIALAQSISMVHGKMVLEGKLVHAAITNVTGLTLFPYWVGERGTDAYRIYISDRSWDDMTDEDLANLKPGQSMRGRRVVDGSVGEWKTLGRDGKVKPAWVGIQTQNQLLYRGTREFARRYEPAVMLGIYTDDEISAAEERHTTRVATVSLTSLPTGFANSPAPVASEPEDAVIEEAVEVAPDAVEDPTAEVAPYLVDEGPEPELHTGGTVDPKPSIVGEDTRETILPAEAAKKPAAKKSAKRGTRKAEEPVDKDPQPSEQGDYPMDAPAGSEEEAVYRAALKAATSWRDIKSALVMGLCKSEAWSTMTEDDQNLLRGEAWIRAEELIEAGTMTFDFLNDLTAFRSWIEVSGLAEAIKYSWEQIVMMDHYQGLDEASQDRLAAAVSKRLATLSGEQ